MQLIKVGKFYINMAQITHIELDERLGSRALYLYAGENTVIIAEPDECDAVLAWLDRNSANVMRKEA